MIAAAIVAFEALAYVVLAVLDVTDLSSERLGFGIVVAVFLLIYGGGHLWAGWRVTQGDAWARSPLIVAQLIQVLIAWNLLTVSVWLAGLLAAAAVTVLICLLAPPVTRALSSDRPV